MMSNFRRISNVISIVLIVGYVIFLIYMWKMIPTTVPTHFNAAGMADKYGSKCSLIFEPVIMAALFLIMAVAERFPGAWNFPVRVTAENRERLYRIGFAMMGAIKILVICVLIDAGISSIYVGFPVWPLYALLALMGVAVVLGIAACVKAR